MLGGYLATDTTEREVRHGNVITPEMVATLEAEIDRLQALLPPLRLFILPGGTHAAAEAHVCRTVCRRAEREMLRLVGEGADVDAPAMAYVNRLSDYLFVLARKANMDAGVEDIIWKRQK